MFSDLDQWISLKAPNTQRHYRAILRELVTFLNIPPNDSGIPRLREIGTSDTNRFINFIRAAPAQPGRSASVSERVSQATVRHKLTVLASIFDELKAMAVVTENPWLRHVERLRSVRGNDRRPHQLVPFEKVAEIFSLRFYGTQGARDRALLSALFYGGLRCSEATALRICDVKEHESGCVRLLLRNTKRQRAENQAIGGDGAKAVLAYAKIRESEAHQNTEPLFVNYFRDNRKPTPISDRTVRRLFLRYTTAVGLKGNYSPHCARATAITKLLEQGKSHREVMKFSRHSTITMVDHYDKMRDVEDDSIAADLSYE